VVGPATLPRERKRITRLLIEDVTINKTDHIHLHIRFRGGQTTSLTIRRHVRRSCPWSCQPLDLRKSLIGAGLLINHRVESEDANALAEALGTHTRPELTNQLDFETGYTQKGSIRHVQSYRVHPNDLRDLPTGYVAARSSSCPAIVQVYAPTPITALTSNLALQSPAFTAVDQ